MLWESRENTDYLKRVTGERRCDRNVYIASAASIHENHDAESCVGCQWKLQVTLPDRRWCRSSPCWVFPDVLVDCADDLDGGVTCVQAWGHEPPPYALAALLGPSFHTVRVGRRYRSLTWRVEACWLQPSSSQSR